ncbi:16S rRNA (adenine(1518)-N(6)/adenine(1519)-N(6))-dimethyltransferase RsmA [Mariniblastus fucicola]|nr:16S rRNA (adenine(1518)-N(6)/adenine(1519)-N(6))-dimethyltransferase RsmA [Mariniblastus fucicola]
MSSNNSNETDNPSNEENDPWARARKVLEDKKAIAERAKAVITGEPLPPSIKEIADAADEKEGEGKKVNRQTVSYLSRRFEEVGLNPNKRHGQNFLVDLNLIQMIAKSADLGKNDVVLEIGTGMGSLTGMLAQKAAHVITVEIDGYLYQMASEELEAFDNIEMLKQDALKNKNQFDDRVIDAIKKALAADSSRVFKLAANLPYNVATPIIANLLRSEVIPATMSVTIQKELADRITAKPGSKDYGSLSVWVQSMADPELVRVMPPHVFWPRPKVDSAILKIVHRPEKAAAVPDIDFFYAFVRAMFFHRRKFMRSVAVAAFKGQLSKPQVDEVLAEAGLREDARTEQLSVEELQSLCELFRQKLVEVTGEQNPRLANQGN